MLFIQPGDMAAAIRKMKEQRAAFLTKVQKHAADNKNPLVAQHFKNLLKDLQS